MEDISVGEDANQGIKIIVSVVELAGQYWSGINLETPPDRDEIPAIEFYVAKDGLQNAQAQLQEIIDHLEQRDEDDGPITI